MEYSNRFFYAIGISPKDKAAISKFSKQSGISVIQLNYYNDRNIIPSGAELESIIKASGKSGQLIQLGMGIIDESLKAQLIKYAEIINEQISWNDQAQRGTKNDFKSALKTNLGELFQGDCIDLMSDLEDNSIDLIFADPPFNLNKLYPSDINDNLKEHEYIRWSEEWLNQCVRILKPGGSLFVWNIPKWSTYYSNFLNSRLTFKHWIAVDIKYSLPIQGRLYPSHYSLLYYIKNRKPEYFKPDRLPMQICPKCYNDLRDYGGYKNKMNPAGVNISDIWYDIPPVRHNKYKKRKDANELSIKLLDRIIEMSSKPGDLIFDPFGGSGTTYIVSELKSRKWLGIEIGPCDDIIERFQNISSEREYLRSIRANLNKLFTDESKIKRQKLGLWTDDTFNANELNTKDNGQIELEFD